ncbi:MAG: homocysteine S-methyltransferase family protein [Armatimonadota bacterium]
MKDYKALLDEKGIVISDGAWGTELAKMGLEVGDAPEQFNLEHPETVQKVAEAYVEAGSEIILTNSFGGSPYKLQKVGLGDEVETVNRTAAELSREAAGEDALVFASVGPTGEFLEPLGLIAEEAMIEAFAQQISALAAGGADAILIETMSDLGEAKAALKAVRDVTDLPAVVSMTFEQGAKELATMMGVKPAEAAQQITEAGADIVGSNCGGGIEQIIDVITLMAPETDRPVWAKPNAGLPELVDGEAVFKETPEEMAAHFEELVEAGADFIGGCCGTTPDHIRLFVQRRNCLQE